MTSSITTKKILKITVKHMIDESPELDWIGTFSNTKESEFSINHKDRYGDRNSFEWFNPQPGVCETQEQVEQEYQRMMQFVRGDVVSMGIRCVAEIATSNNEGKTWTLNEVKSGGLWGIDSDSDKEYFDEVSTEQQRELLPILVALGFSVDEVEAAPLVEDKP